MIEIEKCDLRTGVTDTRTDGRTDRPSYRDARTHLKIAVALSNLFYADLSNVTPHNKLYQNFQFAIFHVHFQDWQNAKNISKIGQYLTINLRTFCRVSLDPEY